MASEAKSHVQLLQCLVDMDDEDDGDYRMLVDDKHVKYLTVAPGVFPKDDRTFGPVVTELLPPFPPGDWNEGHISKDVHTGRPVFSRVVKTELAGVKNAWHQRRIDHLELNKVDRLRQNVHVVTHTQFKSPIVAKFAIDGKGIGPEFLGHITEAGRCIGFLMEYVDGAKTAEPADLLACQRILAKLHALGIKHGDINKHNFLVRDREAVLIDLESARKNGAKEELETEFQRLELSLSDTSGRGGVHIQDSTTNGDAVG
ncbi:hypothetical protein F5Y08DRAFT_351444 [Xylaria arbuscula]|uniref:Alpha-galactosidase A n=1 Tax=Xylaria arbuscula TaxID=114810 RepID=A0A9W8NDA6_9PEZI|nr:hypothetical protein F5Y08DRAFT_351444 [Xylaria arbuscula]KAJ3569556.1 hypothetical protein NPX13_g6038 [Xylaria arbuscula]